MKHTTPPPWFSNYDDLQATLEMAWSLMVRGVADRRSLFHAPSIASVSPTGDPEIRTVVLRGASGQDWSLRFNTDIRSAKFAALSASPKMALHVYDPHLKVQLRLSGAAQLHVAGEQAEAAWSKSLPMSRACYAQKPAPGDALPTPDLPLVHAGQDLDFARQNFAAVVMQVAHIDWLYLLASGHRRARFTRDDAGLVCSQWLAP